MMQRNHDIKAPDGYTLGGLRTVRKDGSILFNRGWWQAPVKWAGNKVWVHEKRIREKGADVVVLEAASPGLDLYEAWSMKPPYTVICERTDRDDAKPQFRNAAEKAWMART